MSGEGEGERKEERAEGEGSEVVVVEGALGPPSDVPTISSLNINKSSRVHIGPKFVNVTQNVNNTEVVKELSLRSYLWNIVKNTTRAELVSCAAALGVLLLCTSLIVYFTVIAKNGQLDVIDKAPHEWNITREMWLAQPYNYTRTTEAFEPLRLVVVQHTVGPECHRFAICAAELRNLQSWYLKDMKYDIPYNFIIGNDGRVYEARGWGVEGAHTRGFNRCSLGLAFVGDYRTELNVHTRVTGAQLERARTLLAEGVRLGRLHARFAVVGACDVTPSESPGSGLLAALRSWPEYAGRRYWNATCERIYDTPPPPDTR